VDVEHDMPAAHRGDEVVEGRVRAEQLGTGGVVVVLHPHAEAVAGRLVVGAIRQRQDEHDIVALAGAGDVLVEVDRADRALDQPVP